MKAPRISSPKRPPAGLSEEQAARWQSAQAEKIAGEYERAGNAYRAARWHSAAKWWLKNAGLA